MIASTTSIEGTSANGVLQSKKLSITSEGISHIANILQDTLYTDKILAPIREYSTNAMDAHREAGKPNLPILVKLPNRFSPVFAVRDYGIGMDDHRIWQVFCNYGSSTKRDTNEQVGMLGIGSKSAFAYPECKSFTVVSIRSGVKKSFVCHKGGCSEGELVQLSEETTTEADGLEIQIPISANDIQQFVDRSAKFFSHWEVTPKFEGATLDIAKVERLFQGDGWYMAKDDPNGYSSPGARVLMGDISYAIGNLITMKASQNGITDNEEYIYRKLLESNLVLKAPIGSVDIAANREALQMTDKTISALWTILKRVRKEIGQELQKSFDVLPTMWEKRVLRHEFSSYYSPMARFSNFLPKHLADLATSIRLGEDTGFEVLTFSRARRGKGRVRSTNYAPWSIEATQSTAIIINTDLTLTGNAVRNRILGLIERQDNLFKKSFGTVYVFNIKDATKFNLWKAANLFDFQHVDLVTLPVYKFSDIYPSTRKPSTRSINADKNSKKFLILDMNLNCTACSDSEYFVAGTVPKKPVSRIPYIVIDRYRVVTSPGGDTSPKNLVSGLKQISKEFKVKLPDVIVAVKNGSVDRLKGNPDYISLWEYMVNLLKKNEAFFNRMVTLQIRKDVPSALQSGGKYIVSGDKSFDSRLLTSLKMDGFDKHGVFYKLAAAYKEIINTVKLPNDSVVCDMTAILSTILNGQTSFNNNVLEAAGRVTGPFMVHANEFLKAYPMIRLMESYSLGYGSKLAVETELTEYIKLVDAGKK